jgi:hypothetical protein
MPVPFGDDTIDAFINAARQREADARVLLERGRHTGAIYLSGYVTELVLKAAVYRNLGHGATASIPSTTRTAVEVMMKMDAYKPQGQHDILRWAQWLVNSKPHLTGVAYTPQFGLEIVTQASIIDQHWHPNMRYRELAFGFLIALDVHAAAS